MKQKFDAKTKIFTLVITIALLLSGCGANNVKSTVPKKFKAAGSSEELNGIVAENNHYQLIWNNEENRIVVYDKEDGSVISTTKNEATGELDEFGLPKQADTRMLSDIIVQYVNAENNELSTVNSNVGAVEMGHLTLKKLEDGIRVTYFFDTEEISIPVEYRLTDDGFSMSINPDDICENKNLVYSVSMAPFACSYKNEDTDSYLFIPSGSGALIYPKTISENGISYSQEVFGADMLNETWEKDSNEQSIKLPVYGVKNGNTALCAIISSGADCANIDATYGSSLLGSSTVYSTFKLRGSTTIKKMIYGARMSTSTQYTDEFIKSVCQVDFYSLKGNDADYVGMAKLFRKKVLKNTDNEVSKDTQMNLVIYGGAEVEKSFLGIPYKSVFATTTINQAGKMIEELTDATQVTASVILKGFGKSGINIGKIGGGYTVNSNLGNISELDELGRLCKEKNIGAYFNFDMVRQSAAGWFSSGDTAKSIDKQTIYQYMYDKALCSRVLESRYSLISRASLTKNTDKLIAKTKNWNIEGIAFDSLSNISYSDYSDIRYRAKDNMASDVSKMLLKFKGSGKKIASVSANLYAAANSDIVFETPNTSNENDGFSVDIPFYQIVFKGKVNINTEAVNLPYDRNSSILKAVESGTGITYALIYNYDTSLTDSLYPVFTTGTYELLKQGIIDEMKSLKEYYQMVNGVSVKEHYLITDDVRKTVFENGTVAYVNYSNTDYRGDFGTVLANGYLIVPAEG